MFGWEFPPDNKGGLGTACEGLVKGLCRKDVEVILVLPQKQECEINHCTIVSPDTKLHKRYVRSLLQGYQTIEGYEAEHAKMHGVKDLYGKNLYDEVERYAEAAKDIAVATDFDVIHAHDWMTFKAGIAAKEASGKPLIVQVHATEFDRSGGLGVTPHVYGLEREGMHKADKIITVSEFTKGKIVEHYGIPADKVRVVHNAVEFTERDFRSSGLASREGPLVLFLGRITLQKGPEYFLEAAKKVLEIREDITFVFAGSGDMQKQMIREVAAAGLSDRILFTGWLRGPDVDKMYQMADLYIMPSVSEPFGITPLEAMRNDVPVIISKQSGVSEILTHCLKVDFWDIDELANKILAVLEHRELKGELTRQGKEEVLGISWDVPAEKCITLYKEVTGG